MVDELSKVAKQIENLPDEAQVILNDYANIFEMSPSLIFYWLIRCDFSTIALFTGNQVGKTKMVCLFIVFAIHGWLPVEHHNIRPEDKVRVIRICAETLPGDAEGEEVKNTVYPALKSLIPAYLIKRDITARRSTMILQDPQGGKDIAIEFVSYSQSVGSQAGVQRRMIYIDEHSPKGFYEEQLPRLVKASSDLRINRKLDADALMVMTLTPAQEYLDWEYDELYERAEVIYRSPAVIKRMKEKMNEKHTIVEHTGIKSGVAIIMAATDDNPVMSQVAIQKLYERYADDDAIDVRRFGLFKQISGVVFKNFNKRVHIRDFEKDFVMGIPYDWLHARGIDFHEYNNWACGWAALSPSNEMFIYDEWYPSPEKFVTLDICTTIGIMSKDYKYFLNLIDPRAAIKQPNSGLSTIDDMNRIFYELRKQGLGTGGYWQSWDTKSQIGRDAIKLRLANSLLCGRPFNNKKDVDGRVTYLPTIWVSSKCKNTIEHMKNWKREQWMNKSTAIMKEPKDSASDKWSHFNMVWEALLKNPAFAVMRYHGSVLGHDTRRRHVA